MSWVGTTVGRKENVVGSQHQDPGLQLGLEAQRDMDGHLVPVEVRVERGANQRMDSNGFPFHQHGFERLDPQSVKGWSPVK